MVILVDFGGEWCFFHVIIVSTNVPTTLLTTEKSSDVMQWNVAATYTIFIINSCCRDASRNCPDSAIEVLKANKKTKLSRAGFSHGRR